MRTRHGARGGGQKSFLANIAQPYTRLNTCKQKSFSNADDFLRAEHLRPFIYNDLELIDSDQILNPLFFLRAFRWHLIFHLFGGHYPLSPAVASAARLA